jgi:hypothetical protein
MASKVAERGLGPSTVFDIGRGTSAMNRRLPTRALAGSDYLVVIAKRENETVRSSA